MATGAAFVGNAQQTSVCLQGPAPQCPERNSPARVAYFGRASRFRRSQRPAPMNPTAPGIPSAMIEIPPPARVAMSAVTVRTQEIVATTNHATGGRCGFSLRSGTAPRL